MIEAKALPTHEQLVSLIQFELDRAEKMAAKPGWTTWALWGALATIAWLAGNEINGSIIAWEAVWSWFLFASILTDLIALIHGLLTPESGQQNQGHRFTIANSSLGFARSLLTVLLVRYGILTILCINYSSLLSPWNAYPLAAYASLLSISFAILLAYSFLNYPLPSTQTPPTRSKNIISALPVLLVSMGTTSLFITLNKYTDSLSLTNIRVTGLLWTASMLIILLNMTRSKSPLIGPLINIRRDLGLNNIDVPTAKRQIELAIHGLQVADILQQEVSAVLTPLRLALNAQDQIDQELQALLAQLPTDSSSDLTSTQKHLVSAVMRSFESLIADVNKRLDESEAAATLFTGKAKIIIGLNSNTEPEIDTLRAEIKSAIKDLRERTDAGFASIKKLAVRTRTIEPHKQQGSNLPTPT